MKNKDKWNLNENTGQPEGFTKDELIGKIVLVGFTYYRKNGEFAERKQFFGKVFEVLESTVWIRKNNGEEFSIPNDKNAIEIAPEGEYRLKTTGEVVVNPDYLSTWNVTMNE